MAADDPRKAMSQDAAAEEGAQFAHDEARKGGAIGVGREAGEKRLQVFGEEYIERGLLRLAAAVAAWLGRDGFRMGVGLRGVGHAGLTCSPGEGDSAPSLVSRREKP